MFVSVSRRARTSMLRIPLVRFAQETWATASVAWRVGVGKEDAWPGMQQPFNGQRLRLTTVRDLIAQFEPDAFIETGTFIGSTTRFFSGNGVPVYTSEVKRTFWLLARLRLGWSTDLALLRCDSRAALEQLANQDGFARPLVYLDAHWWSDFPLDDELRLIFDSWEDSVVVVDDFRVDGDEGYSYDTYQGRALALDQIVLPAGVAAALPGYASDKETGARRGALYLAKGPNAQRAVEHAVARGLLRFV